MGDKMEEENFEINLFPIISLLAVLISFLLLTTAWVQIKSLDISQATGAKSTLSSDETEVSLELIWDQRQGIEVYVKNAPRTARGTYVSRTSIDKSIEVKLQKIIKRFPEIKMALLVPNTGTSYQAIIGVIDALKKNKMNHVGITPIQI